MHARSAHFGYGSIDRSDCDVGSAIQRIEGAEPRADAGACKREGIFLTGQRLVQPEGPAIEKREKMPIGDGRRNCLAEGRRTEFDRTGGAVIAEPLGLEIAPDAVGSAGT